MLTDFGAGDSVTSNAADQRAAGTVASDQAAVDRTPAAEQRGHGGTRHALAQGEVGPCPGGGEPAHEAAALGVVVAAGRGVREVAHRSLDVCPSPISQPEHRRLPHRLRQERRPKDDLPLRTIVALARCAQCHERSSTGIPDGGSVVSKISLLVLAAEPARNRIASVHHTFANPPMRHTGH